MSLVENWFDLILWLVIFMGFWGGRGEKFKDKVLEYCDVLGLGDKRELVKDIDKE